MRADHIADAAAWAARGLCLSRPSSASGSASISTQNGGNGLQSIQQKVRHNYAPRLAAATKNSRRWHDAPTASSTISTALVRMRLSSSTTSTTGFRSENARPTGTIAALPPRERFGTKNSRRWRDAPIDKKCSLDRRIAVVCCPELERVRPLIVRGSTAPPAQVHQ
jgi:hypothetical protein